MALNLVRNSRLFFTSNVDSTSGVIATSSHTTATTYEIQVLDGFSFTQNTSSETVTVSEAGVAPLRGQRTFNTALAPVDFSFSTYIRPYTETSIVKAEDAVLWNALGGTAALNTKLTRSSTGAITVTYAAASNQLTISAATTLGVTGLAAGDFVLINGITSTEPSEQKFLNGPARVVSVTTTTAVFEMFNSPGTTTTGTITGTNFDVYTSAWSQTTAATVMGFHKSNQNQLQKFGLVFIVDGVTYLIDNAAMGQVTIDFGLDGIATAQWTGQATAIRELATTVTTATAGTFGGGFTGNYTQKSTNSNYITNKLSTATLKTVKALVKGDGTTVTAANTPYYIAITGGSITINNNISYITPATLGIVNTPVAYFTGTRSVTGTLNAYLNTGSVSGFSGGGTGNLLKDMLLAASGTTEPMFALDMAIGGSSRALKVELQMPSAALSVPTLNTEQVVSTTINFTAAPSKQTAVTGTTVYDLEAANELTVRYYAPA